MESGDDILRELDPCPFCGGKDLEMDMEAEVHTGRVRVKCRRCCVGLEFDVRGSPTLDDLKAHWNGWCS